MRVSTISSGRPAYYDRNPTTPSQVFENTGGLAPGGTVVEWTYTVPSGRKAYLETAEVLSWRKTAAAPVGDVDSFIRYTPVTGGQIKIVGIGYNDNTVGARDRGLISGAAIMLAGDILRGNFEDVSTGGTTAQIINAKITEFDA